MSGYTQNRDSWQVIERASNMIKMRHTNSKQSHHYSFGTEPNTFEQSRKHSCYSTF